jgi:phenazine biosynthesis protein phzE
MAYDAAAHPADILVIGPGPGDPTDRTHARMARLQQILAAAKAAATPRLGVCLGHQALAVHEGLTVTRQDRSSQGMQKQLEIFGRSHRLGFYNSFSPVMDEKAAARGDIAFDADGENRIQAMRGPGFIGFQFHPESVMSETGLDLLREALRALAA